MSGIDHIVFDLGRVVLRWEPELPYRQLIPDEAERRRFLTEVCNAEWLLRTDLGVSWAEAERDLIARFPADEAMIRAFRPHWHDMTPGTIAETIPILTGLLDGGHDVTALTNFASDTFDEISEREPVLKRFRGVTVSARARLAKPDLAIYRKHAADFRLVPSATLFFDDNPHNVEAARRAGWNAEVFTGAPQMRADLVRYGVTQA